MFFEKKNNNNKTHSERIDFSGAFHKVRVKFMGKNNEHASQIESDTHALTKYAYSNFL